MKFIGQYIQSFIARFRNDVYLEDVSTGTIASGGNLGLDSNNKIVKAISCNFSSLSIPLLIAISLFFVFESSGKHSVNLNPTQEASEYLSFL